MAGPTPGLSPPLSSCRALLLQPKFYPSSHEDVGLPVCNGTPQALPARDHPGHHGPDEQGSRHSRGSTQRGSLGRFVPFSHTGIGPPKTRRIVFNGQSKDGTRIELWNKGQLDILATRAKAAIRLPSGRSKSQRASRRAAQVLRKNQFAKTATLAGSLGVADATEDTIRATPPLFP